MINSDSASLLLFFHNPHTRRLFSIIHPFITKIGMRIHTCAIMKWSFKKKTLSWTPISLMKISGKTRDRKEISFPLSFLMAENPKSFQMIKKYKTGLKSFPCPLNWTVEAGFTLLLFLSTHRSKKFPATHITKKRISKNSWIAIRLISSKRVAEIHSIPHHLHEIPVLHNTVSFAEELDFVPIEVNLERSFLVSWAVKS